MKKKILIAISIIATITLGTITGCAAYESSSHQEVISDTSISSENEPTSSEDSSNEYIVDSSKDESSETDSSENDSSETDSSEDESSEVEKVTTKTPKKVEDSSSEDDNSSKVTTTKKTETPKTTTTTKTTQAPVTQKPATTTKTTTKKPVTQPNGSHTHNWVKYREADGIKYYQCTICGELKEEGKKTATTTTKVQPTSKTIKSNEWIPVYFKTVVANCVADGYDKKTGKHLDWLSPTYWDVKALSRGEAKALADYKKANDEASAWCDTVNAGAWVQGGNDHPINTPDKSSIAFWYYRDSNGKLAIQFPNGPNQLYSGIKTEADLKTYGCYDRVSRIGTPGLGYDVVYYTGTPWAK